MPHGTPDWSLDWTPRTIWGLEDLGEHAVRVGSHHIWDRRGDVLLLDSFEEGLAKPSIDTDGAGGYARLFAGAAAHGVLCVTLWTDDTTGNYVLLQYRHGPAVTSRIGFEYSLRCSLTTIHQWYWFIDWVDGTTEWRARVRLNVPGWTLQYYDTTGTYQTFATLNPVVLGFRPWQVGKLVADFDEGRYVRFIYNDTEYDLTPYALWQTPNGRQPYFDAQARLETRQNVPTQGYLDAVIITHNED